MVQPMNIRPQSPWKGLKPGGIFADEHPAFSLGRIFLPGAAEHEKRINETLLRKDYAMEGGTLDDLKVEYGDWEITHEEPPRGTRHLMVVVQERNADGWVPDIVYAPIFFVEPKKATRAERLAEVPTGGVVAYTDRDGLPVTAVRLRENRWANFTVDDEQDGEAVQSTFHDNGLLDDMGRNDFEVLTS